jgi:FRG domain-containing protein
MALPKPPLSSSIKSTIRARVQARFAALDTWRQLLAWVQEHEAPRWVFRGQREHFALRPKIGRSTYRYDSGREIQALDEFRRLATPMVNRAAVISEWDWLFVAQHHGLPTRLLDWTTNALIATYFACQPSPRAKKAGEIVAVRTADVGVMKISTDGAGPFEVIEPRFVYPTALSARITAQRGIFSVHPNPDRNWVLKNKTDRFTIPAAHKRWLLRFLAGAGVDAASVMTDIDGLAGHIEWRLREGLPIQ